jgi:hypothetical protein
MHPLILCFIPLLHLRGEVENSGIGLRICASFSSKVRVRVKRIRVRVRVRNDRRRG